MDRIFKYRIHASTSQNRTSALFLHSKKNFSLQIRIIYSITYSSTRELDRERNLGMKKGWFEPKHISVYSTTIEKIILDVHQPCTFTYFEPTPSLFLSSLDSLHGCLRSEESRFSMNRIFLSLLGAEGKNFQKISKM